jgi:hypothetical protein
MSALPSSQGQGALFELVARGVKDKYFVADQKDSEFIHDARYSSSLPHLAERRTTVPVNGTAFGGTFEVEIDPYGDVLTECGLEIQLPTWIPPLPLVPGGPPVEAAVVNGLCSVTASSGGGGGGGGASYGYVNYAGYFLLEKVQFYQDQYLVQEWSGDGLLAKQLTEGSYHYGALRLLKGGGLDTAERTPLRNLQLRATPGRLHVLLPLVGCSGPDDVGLPLVAMTWQTLRLRVTLRKAEELVVCSDDGVFHPAPWSVPLMQYTMTDGVTTGTFTPLSLSAMGAPTVLLSTVQRYVTPEAQQEMRGMRFEIPFRRLFENRFTFGELDYVSLDKGGVSAVTRRLEGRHPTERLFWFFRLKEAVDKGRLDDWTNSYFGDHPTTETQPLTWPYGGFYYQVKLLIAGRDRERLESGEVWDISVPWAKAERVTGAGTSGLGIMDWGLGDRMGTPYPAVGGRVPTGTVNFTTADRPTLYIELANVPVHPMMAQRVTEMRAWSEAWDVYVVEEGRGRVLFAA